MKAKTSKYNTFPPKNENVLSFLLSEAKSPFDSVNKSIFKVLTVQCTIIIYHYQEI